MANKKVGIKLTANISDFQSKMKTVQKGFKSTSKSLKKVGKAMTVGLTAPLAAFAGASIRAFDKQQKAIAQVEQGLKTTGGQVGRTSQQLQKMASDLQSKTLFGDEVILRDATAQLLTFTNITGKQFDRTQQAALDLATRLDGDLKSASIQLGKALNDPVANLSALSRSGIQFSADQKQVINSLVETGKLAEAQTIILNELEKQYGGSAAAAAKAGAGGLKQLQNSFGDLMEDIGGLLIPVLNKLVGFIQGLITSFNGLDKGTKVIIVSIGGVVALLGPAISLFGALAGVIGGLSLPIIGIIAGLAALVAAIMYAADNWEAIKERAEMAFALVKNALISLLQFFIKNNLFSWLIDGYNEVLKLMGKEQVKNPFDSIAEKLEEFKTDVPKAKTEFKDFFTSIKNSAVNAASAMGVLGSNLGVGGATGREQTGIIKLQKKELQSGGGGLGGEPIRVNYEIPDAPLMTFEEKVFNVMDGMSNAVLNFAEKFGTAIGQAFDLAGTLLDNQQIKLDNYYASEAEKIEKSKMNEEQKKAALLALDEKVAKKQAAINKKKAIAEKAMAIFQAIINTAANVTKVLANPAMAAVVGALGAAQVAAIAAAPLPAMENGGVLAAGQPALIGEAGPEIFQPTTGGMVLPNSVLGGLGGNVNVSGHFVVQGTDLVAAINNQLESDYGQSAQKL